MFLQKWNDGPKAPPRLRCPRVDGCRNFFAVSEKGGEDNSGEYVYLTDKGGRLRDLHAYPMVDR